MFDINDYSDKYAAQYVDQSFETVLVAIRRKQVLESLGRYPHRRVLEVGCGLEPLFLSCDDFDSYVVVEPAGEFVQTAIGLAAGRHEIEVIQGFFEEESARFRGQRSFDFVVVSSLLHEVADPIRLLRAIRQVCNDTTIVHFNVPNVHSFHRLLAVEMGLMESIFEPSATETKFQRTTRFDRERLATMLADAGFQIEESGSYFVKPFSHAQMESILQSGIADRALIHGLERMTKYMPEMGCEIFANARIA